jgi:hypothetical protein
MTLETADRNLIRLALLRLPYADQVPGPAIGTAKTGYEVSEWIERYEQTLRVLLQVIREEAERNDAAAERLRLARRALERALEAITPES